MLAISRVKDEALGIRSYELVDPQGRSLPTFEAGAHIDLHVNNDLVRSYSLCNDPHDRNSYVIAVLRQLTGRGGSNAIHEELLQGDRVLVSDPKNGFPLVEDARHHTLIAGGIGITPFLSMIRLLEATAGSYSLHYCVRDLERAAFRSVLEAPPYDRHTETYVSGGNPRERLDVRSLLRQQQAGQHVYCCGPPNLLEAVRKATQAWRAGTVHFERFQADASLAGPSSLNLSFEVEIASTGQVFNIPPDKSILEVFRENSFPHPWSCGEGICGTCEAGILSGVAEHRDSVLSEDEKESQTVLMVCCARAASERLVLDL